jgi:hypothetical protein
MTAIIIQLGNRPNVKSYEHGIYVQSEIWHDNSLIDVSSTVPPEGDTVTVKTLVDSCVRGLE